MIKVFLHFSLFLSMSAVFAQDCKDSISESTPTDRFIINGDEVIDTRTQLVWKHCTLGRTGSNCESGMANTYTWQQALQEAYTDPASDDPQWRLPNLKELQSIREQRCAGPSVNLGVFPETEQAGYWTASHSARNGTDAWAVNFRFGSSNHLSKTNTYHIRQVRNVYFQ